MSFWTRFKESLYSPTLYAQVAVEPLSSAFKYFIFLAAFLSLVAAGLVAFNIIPPIQEFSHATLDAGVSAIPEDLSIRIQKNIASAKSSSPEPIFFDAPLAEGEEPFSYVVINTKEDFSYDRFLSYNSFVWIARNGVGFIEEPGKISFNYFEGIEDLTVTRTLIIETIETVRSYLWIFYVLLVPIVFLFIFVGACFTLIYLLLVACVVWVIGKMKGIVLSYSQAYSIALYAVTAGFLFMILQVFLLPFSVPFGFSIIVLLVAALSLDPQAFGQKTAE